MREAFTGGLNEQVFPHVALQQVEHALLCDLFALVKLLQRLFDLLVLNFSLTLLLVVEVQATTLHLLQMVLDWMETCLGSERETKS